MDREVEVTGPGYLTVTVTPEALAAVADNVTAEGPACVTSDALTGVTVPAAPPGDPLAAATWEEARTALAARLTARLAAAAGATVAEFAATERNRLTPHQPAAVFFRTVGGSGVAAEAAAADRTPRGRSPSRGGTRSVYPGQGHPGQAAAGRPGR